MTATKISATPVKKWSRAKIMLGLKKNNDVWIVSEKEKAAKSQEKRKVWHSRLDVIDNIALLHHVKPAFKNKPNIKGSVFTLEESCNHVSYFSSFEIHHWWFSKPDHCVSRHHRTGRLQNTLSQTWKSHRSWLGNWVKKMKHRWAKRHWFGILN